MPTVSQNAQLTATDRSAWFAIASSALSKNLERFNVNHFRNFLSKPPGIGNLHELEEIGIRIDWPEEYFEAAAELLAKGQNLPFGLGKIPAKIREQILAGIWSHLKSDPNAVTTTILQDHLEGYIRGDSTRREEFLEGVLPTILRSDSDDHVRWGVGYLKSLHRKSRNIPDPAAAQIQDALTDAYPESSGPLRETLESLWARVRFYLHKDASPKQLGPVRDAGHDLRHVRPEKYTTYGAMHKRLGLDLSDQIYEDFRPV